MRIDITSFFFNTTIPEATATAAWGTAICIQDKEKTYKIKNNDASIVDLLIGMNYKVSSDIKNLDISKMRSSELLFFSIFEKVYINGIKIKNSFILLFLKEQSETHRGRLRVSYPNYASYNKMVYNQNAIKEFEDVLKINKGSWFVYDISVLNQDELHFNAIIVNANKAMTYNTSKERGEIWKELIEENEPKQKNPNSSYNSIEKSQQLIFYGSPGTGKSNKADEYTKKGNVQKVTFHPDYDYNSFVGGYKPTMDGDKIAYKYVPQIFTKIYVDAWKDLDNQYFLVIEEINRGNCAEIFGDLFQLLDRDKDGFSKYEVTAEEELCKYLLSEKGFGGNHQGIENGKLRFPNNLKIIATMNTSDQSLFPMDSAFKRRWDWEYVPIDYYCEKSNFIIELDNGKKFKWLDFLKSVNKEIFEIDNNQDKQIGNWFINAEHTDNVILEKKFLNKVIFYLWNDVFKDEEKTIFKAADGKNLTYTSFFENDTSNNLVSYILQERLKLIDVNKAEPTTTGEE